MTDNITKTAQVHNERDDIWNDRYEADAVGGGRVTVEVPRDVREPGNVRKHLLRKGADISDLEHARGELSDASQSDAPIARRAGNVGWREDNRYYVDFLHVVGCGDGTILPPMTKDLTSCLALRGTLLDWQDLIDVARYSTTMVTCLSTAFAAPLMSLLNCPNFGIVLIGPSGCAKTTAKLVAASANGFGKEEELPTPKGTDAGLNEAPLFFNDHMLPINELGAAKGGRLGKDGAVYEMTYSLLSGRDTIRHSSSPVGSGMGTSFKVLIVMSSEFSPDEWAARAGQTRDPGESRRLIGVPALHSGYPTVYDSFPGDVSLKDRGAWIYEQHSLVRNGLPDLRGVAFKVFLEALVADRETFVANAIEDAAEFRDRLKKRAVSHIAADIIAKFGVIYAGGRAAADAKVLRFDSTTIFQAIRRACVAALNSLPNAEADLAKDLLTLKGQLEGVGVIDADEASTKQKRNMDQAEGYYEKAEPGIKYTMRAASLMTAFPSPMRARRIVEWLDSEGFLRHQRERKAGVSTEWAQTQTIWPSGQRVRSFVLYFPSGLDVLDLDG